MLKFASSRFASKIAGTMFAALAMLSGLASPSTAVAGAPIVIERSVTAAGAAPAVRHRITVSAVDLNAMQPGESFSLSIPGHSSPFEIVFDRFDTSSPIAPASWVGHLQGYADDYRTVITATAGHSVGRIATPEGNFQIDSLDGVSTLTDVARAGYKVPSFENDALPTPRAVREGRVMEKMQARAASVQASASASGPATIDVLVVYNPAFVTATGNAVSTISNLIAVANSAMADSNVAITFRLVGTQQINMSDTDSESTVLQKITYPSDPSFIPAQYADPVYSGVPALRTQYGADLVVAIRQFNANHVSCGLAWLLTDYADGSAQGIAADAPDAYAVVSYGQYQASANTYYVCDQVTMAHEMGHNLGSAHDYGHAQQSDGSYPSAFPYSFGYGFQDQFATVMAANYISPATNLVKYSSPSLTCLGQPCGVGGSTLGTSANNAASLSITGPFAAQFMRTVVANAATPATGYWWNPTAPGSGFNIEQRGNNLFMATFLYDANTGEATWYGLGPGAMSGSTFTGTLTKYAGGQQLAGGFRQASVIGTAGTFSVTFSSATQGTVTWPGGTTIPIERYDFGPGGSAATPPAGTPQAGWWYSPVEGGRGFAVEIQGGSMFLAGYMYDGAGNPVWYASGPTPMTSAVVSTGPAIYQGVWQQFANGQSLAGIYRAPIVFSYNSGAAIIQFNTTTSGTMTFPDGHSVAITRYLF